MSIPLKQIIKSSDCFSCRDCCEFDSNFTYFAPVFSKPEFEVIKKMGIDVKLFKKLDDNTWQVILSKNRKKFICPFLDKKSRKCKIYELRPFDCKIYPFILMWNKERKKILLGVFSSQCPHISKKLDTKTGKKYLSYLKNYLNSDEIISFLKKYPRLVWRYDENATVVCNLDRLTKSLIDMF